MTRTQQYRQQTTEAILAVYDRLSPRERDVLERAQQALVASVDVRGFGPRAATEVLGKVGIFLATHPGVAQGTGVRARPIQSFLLRGG